MIILLAYISGYPTTVAEYGKIDKSMCKELKKTTGKLDTIFPKIRLRALRVSKKGAHGKIAKTNESQNGIWRFQGRPPLYVAVMAVLINLH